MKRAAGGVLVALALFAAASRGAAAQDTTAGARHVLPIDASRFQPFRRTYDIVVHSPDSATVVGSREVVATAATYAGAQAWLVVETRTGLVPAAESLYLSPSLRPLHWSSIMGAARLGAEFVGDSVYGATSAFNGKQNIVLGSRRDLLVSVPMIEAVLPLLPLGTTWADSVGVLAVDLASSAIVGAELAVIGEEVFFVDSLTTRPAWVVALRAESRNVLFWVEKETGVVFRVQQPLPVHIGTLLEYRIRQEPTTAPPES
jgi:hypothetical protein